MADNKKIDLNWPRLAVACGVALTVAVLVSLQALSDAVQRQSPETAIATTPFNGIALERLAYDRFRDRAVNLSAFQQTAQQSTRTAVQSFRKEPLVPKSWALMALAEPQIEKRRRIIEVANRLNRRDPFFQRISLREAIEDQDFDATVGAVDRILRVRPRQSDDLIPVLVSAIENPQSAEEFDQILDFTAPWHERFLIAAVRSPQARVTLAQMQSTFRAENPAYLRQLISGLSRQGEDELALGVYEAAKELPSEKPLSKEAIDWEGTYPPFDWDLTSRPELRAQVSLDGDTLEIFARTGNGGVAAQRVLRFENKPITLVVGVRSDKELMPGNLVLTVGCSSLKNAIVEQDLIQGENIVQITSFPPTCEQATLALEARAFTGQPNLRVKAEKIRNTPLGVR